MKIIKLYYSNFVVYKGIQKRVKLPHHVQTTHGAHQATNNTSHNDREV